MKNVLTIAVREFVATVATRAFVIGLLLFPLMLGVFALVGPSLFNPRNVEVRGEVMVVDPTGQVIERLRRNFDRDQIVARRAEEARQVLAGAPPGVQALATTAIEGNEDGGR
jgi:ABC-type Na+ efflux pump permease subunit